ncbi:alcohol dehydrogenase catalytic domain-containing protein [Sphingobium sp.]|uniref:alcohol dehydrogenase catalytic domain-containing protein n=1 Tax=Sphingobium sp. TaxID=1912891 RepID=UPI002CCFB5F7|nr:alcohol dehydrogenase catalytic domain-containing protein [Sphingobium sp.]HUD90056.1 alcohol dehydrogenase catalytic domain-containing protein [Sphingobium sp.]
MKAAIFVQAGQPLAIEDRPIPQPGSYQALIRVHRCGICGSDLHMTSGSAFDIPCGTVLGHEYAGEVVDIGPHASSLKVGDRVTALPMSACGDCPACRADMPLHCIGLQSMAGGYGEYTLIDARKAIRLPDGLSFEDGALVEPLASALRGVRRIRNLDAKTRVAIVGAGAIGASAAFWARRLGAGRVAMIARSHRNEGLAAAMGADGFLTVGDDLPTRLETVLGGTPDVVIEGAGSAGAIQQSITLVRNGGTVVSLGGCIQPDQILPAIAMFKDITLQFSVAYGLADFRQCVETLNAGAVEPRALVGETISLTDLPARFDAMRTGSHPAKVMVNPMAG